jgi:hypothetical protein
MKKKILFGLGTLALVGMLSLNINLAKSNNAGDFSLKSLFSVPQASAEFDPIALCNAYCWPTGYLCDLVTNYGFHIYCYGWDEPF